MQELVRGGRGWGWGWQVVLLRQRTLRQDAEAAALAGECARLRRERDEVAAAFAAFRARCGAALADVEEGGGRAEAAAPWP